MSEQPQYFTASPQVPSRPAQVDLVLPDLTVTLTTDRGVFSPDRVDVGTRLLCLEAPAPPPTGIGLDLGCGYGPIAHTLATRASGVAVWAVDVNERARALCRLNTAELGNVTVVAPDEVPDGLRFDVIWSNPPIRIGKPALHDFLLTWLGRLASDGIAVLVVQRHLGADSLATWLGAQGYDVERVASRQGYRLLTVRRLP